MARRLLGRERRRLREKAMAALRELGTDDWAALACRSLDGSATSAYSRMHSDEMVKR